MKIDWRISAIAAGSAFLLSILVGILGNVSFGAVILRAVIAGAVFGAGAIGISLVVDRFLPELRSGGEPAREEGSAGAVDIVVEGDADYDSVVHADDAVSGDGESLDTYAPLEGQTESDGVLEEVDENGDEGESVAGDVEEIGAVDDLPSVESMGDSFTEVPLGEETIGDVSSGEDPALMARAIRSVLKREG